MKLETLYLVDDDETFQFIARHTIESLHIIDSIRVFSNGQAAIEFLRSAMDTPKLLPDIILLDLTMPVLDGWGFLEDFVALQPRIGKKIRIYVVSSSINPADVERAKNISAVTDYVITPITQEKFIALLQNL